MRLRTALLATVFAAVALSPVPASAVDTTAWNYRVCEHHGGVGGLFNPWDVCMKSVISRQADGTGYNIGRVHIYAFSDSDQGTCGGAFNDSGGPAVVNNGVDVNAVSAGGSVTNRFHTTSPDLSDSNDCDHNYSDDLVANAAGMQVRFEWKARVAARPDVTSVLAFVLTSGGGWGCGGSGTTCTRDLA